MVRKFNLFLFIFLLLFYGLWFAQKVNWVAADLGRHLKNGEMILRGQPLVLQENLYSYTSPDFPFLNHHWGSGVVFFIINRIFGFPGLSIFFAAISLLTLFFFFDVARRSSSFGLAFVLAFLSLPLLGSRLEVRPEAFSYLFCGFFLWLLWRWQKGEISFRFLFILPIIELLWVNLHLYFFLGPFLVAVFCLDFKNFKKLVPIFFLCSLVCLFNPVGIRGAAYPLKIFQNYGYRLFENQSVFFLEKIVTYQPILYFKIIFALLTLSWFWVFLTKKKINPLFLGLYSLFSFMAWKAVRNFNLFGFFALPIMAINLKDLWERLVKRGDETWEPFLSATLGTMILLALFLSSPPFWLNRLKPGLGIEKGSDGSAKFFLGNKLKGPIFNNYDIGSYLIYYLYPQEKVFVDNRPEAYPSSFFQNVYIPMQENNEKWQEEDKNFNFNTIFFYRHDLTPWGQNFLLERIQDTSWAPVYVDDWTIIFLKRNEVNKSLISKYELPKEMFTITK